MLAKYVEMSGRALMSLLEPDEVSPEALRRAGLTDTCLVRVNLTGKFGPRVEAASGRTWAS
jgi:hypothetical protein